MWWFLEKILVLLEFLVAIITLYYILENSEDLEDIQEDIDNKNNK